MLGGDAAAAARAGGGGGGGVRGTRIWRRWRRRWPGQPVPPVVAAWLPGLVTAAGEAAAGEAGAAGDDAGAVRRVVHAVLELVQEWLAEEAFAGSVLVRGDVGGGGGRAG